MRVTKLSIIRVVPVLPNSIRLQVQRNCIAQFVRARVRVFVRACAVELKRKKVQIFVEKFGKHKTNCVTLRLR